MPRLVSEHPYLDHLVYDFVHKKQKRRYVVLVDKVSRKYSCMSFARYRMSVKVGRKLEKHEEVDHIDEDRLNDADDNLQILTPKANKIKTSERLIVPEVELKCMVCGEKFIRPKSYVRDREKRGQRILCSRRCAGKAGKKASVAQG